MTDPDVRTTVSPAVGSMHHVELWVPDLQHANRAWGWLLGRLGYQQFQDWPDGCSWRLGDTYLVVEQSPALTATEHDRLRPGLNHLALHAGSRADVDALTTAAPAHGWSLLFADRHPYAGGPDHYAAYLVDSDGFEVELVARTGDADYGQIGAGYATYRVADPRIAALVRDALGDAEHVLNVGAGTGSYEPRDRQVTAVEPSATMRAQRPPDLPGAIDATAEKLPFADHTFDAAMTTFSVHHWPDLAAGLAEVRRVTRGPVVMLTCDPELVQDFWLAEYAPEVLATEARRYPPLSRIAELLGEDSSVTAVPIPLDCTDGFNEAYYGRPEMLLDADARRACSAWSFIPLEQADRYTQALAAALDDGSWDARYGALRSQPSYTGSLVLVTSTPTRRSRP